MERELLLLGLLRRQDMHGYQLNEFIERDLTMCTDLKKSTAYFLLDKLVKDELVSFQQTQEGARPPRRVYHLTEKGEAEFQRLLRENLSVYDPVRFPNDIGLLFADALPADELLRLLQDQRESLQLALAAIEAAPPHPGPLQWVIDHRRAHLQSELDWLTTIIARLATETAS
ncbi:MAG: PadR family transcriptional regulator [Anaerolineae bacterium]|nr:PadR family transcriptional regulator [Anaerolineae bacterium]